MSSTLRRAEEPDTSPVAVRYGGVTLRLKAPLDPPQDIAYPSTTM